MAGLYHYFVEGECEKALLNAFMHTDKTEYTICPGKIDIFNVMNEKLSPARAMSIKKGTRLVFVYDTDTSNIDILKYNINIVMKYTSVSFEDIIFLQSVKTLEDEIVRSSAMIDSINQLFSTQGSSEFKKKFIKHSDIISKLLSVGFSIKKMWSTDPPPEFIEYKCDVNLILEKRCK